MKSTIEPLEGNKVKLSVSFDEAELEPAIDKAWKQIAKEVRIPGFRAGKVPRKVLEQRIEKEYARSEALRDAIPEFYLKAIREHSVDVIDQPEIDITDGEESGDVHFDATVEIRPEITITGYQDLTITIPSPEPSDDDIADQVDRLRGSYAELVEVERPAASDDHLVIDITGSRDGEEIDGLVAEDYSYQLGSGAIIAELDEQLRGLKAGDTAGFDAPHPDPSDEEPVHYEVVLKEVKERVLPDLTDEWVAEATEFETVDAFRDDIIERLTKVKKAQASMAVQSKIGDALAELVTDEIPDALASGEMRSRLEDMVRRLAAQGITLEQYLQITGTDAQAFTDDLRETAAQAVKVDLALRAISVAEGLSPSDEDVDAEIEHMALHLELEPDEVRSRLEEGDQFGALRADLGNRAALRWLTDSVTIVDESGKPVNRDLLDLADEEHDHDHDHDHEGHDHDHDDDD